MQFDPVGDVLRAELPALGFSIEGEHAEATFTAVIETSDFAPVRLELTLREHKTGRTLWRVQVERKWDLYASIVSASKSNARLAMKLLRIDLAAAKAPR